MKPIYLIIIMLVLLVGMVLIAVFAITNLEKDFGTALDKQMTKEDETWECIDHCDSYNIKPSHESCKRWCT